MFDAAPMNPAELAAMVEHTQEYSTKGERARARSVKRSAKPEVNRLRRIQENVESSSFHEFPEAAYHSPQSTSDAPRSGTPTTSQARSDSEPILTTPDWSTGHITLGPYDPEPIAEIVAEIVSLHRLRQGMIKAQTKLKLQGMASIRFMTQTDDDFASDEAKEKARKRADDLYRQVVDDPAHPMHANVAPYLQAMGPLDAQRALYEKELVKAAKRLPVYEWVKSVKGFGDISFASIVGECGDIGTYKSVSAVWKRLGLAVVGGKRQGAPGLGATAEDWIAHGYNRQRRSISYVAREHVIGGMGKWRPAMGGDLADATYYQRVYAERARYEAEKLGLPVTESAKGKESYKKHVSMRAHRYVEKRLLKHLYIEWRRA